MKKNVLALSIAAAVAGFGAMGSAHAITTIQSSLAFGVVPGTEARTLALNPSGIGHILLVPYFTAQQSNVTLISLVNTDATNGKAVKVRFRGAANSDDLFDFIIYLSPSDVWTGMINRDANGKGKIVTDDASCMTGLYRSSKIPQPPENGHFSTVRLGKQFPTDPLIAPTLPNQTREGYIEIFNMADIAPKLWVTNATPSLGVFGTADNPVYTGIKHAAGVASCAGLSALETDAGFWAGLTPPSTGLMGEWLILNQQTAAAFGGTATAIQALNVSNKPGYGNVVFWPQSTLNFDKWPSSRFTADPLLAGDPYLSGTNAVVPAVWPKLQDFPDLSTPYTYDSAILPGAAGPADQVTKLTNAIAALTVNNEFLTNPLIKAETDFVISMPTRRYHVAMNYETLLPIFNSTIATGEPFFSVVNVQKYGRQACVLGMSVKSYDQEERMVSDIAPSPQGQQQFCGEANVVGINQGKFTADSSTAVLGANISVQSYDATWENGWLRIVTDGLRYGPADALVYKGLPILGSAFKIAENGPSNFGVNAEHRTTRPIGFEY